MVTQLEPQPRSVLTPEFMATDLEALQRECAEIASHGGELGSIATEIARISRELSALSAKADEFLASPTAS